MGSHAASCPDLGSLQPASLLPPSGGSFGTLASVGEEEELVEEPDPQQQQQWHLHTNVSPSYHQAMVGPSGVPTPLPLGPMRIPGAPPVPGAQAGQPPFGYPGGAASSSSRRHTGATPGTPPSSSSGGGGKGRPPAGGRSVSMPDISSYAAQADAEEAKRRKRLARNRASARLRRLRKKNLVDSYEGEVRALEASLEKLKSHSWGVGADASDLLEALSMDRGQQHVDAAKRIELVASILAQQREHIQNVRECQLETCVLGW